LKKNRKRKSVGRGSRTGRPPRVKDHGHDPDADQRPRREKILRGHRHAELPPDVASETERAGDVRSGRVVGIRGTDVRVQPDEGADVSTIFRRSTRVPHPQASAVVVGDRVSYLAAGDEPFVLTEVHERRNSLSRVRRGREEHVLCANVDLGIIVASAVDPTFKPRLVDRYLISYATGGIDPVLVLNKVDLLEGRTAKQMLSSYDHLEELRTVAVSAVTGAGMDELRELLQDNIAVLAGQSGVGKSSLVNALGGLELATQEVQESTGKGRHTTTYSTLYRFPSGGALIDTPGVRSFQVHEPTPEALERFFPEIMTAAAECRFRDCSHQGEAGCAVPEAVRQGHVSEDRLESFRILLDEMQGKG
jgi:ribosome biogenesis GTPase